MQILQNKIREAMAHYRVPGVALGILQDGTEHYICEGVTHIFNPLEITRDTLFQIASNTKTMTGVLVMKLVEEGKLELDTPIRKYLPDLKLADGSVAEQVTMRHLLNHTGGWVGDLFANTGDGDDALEHYVARIHTMPQLTPLGTLWHYNNAAFGIAGRVIEVLTNKPFEQAMKETLFEPLGMTRSNFFPHEAILERHCVGHYVDENQQVQISKPWSFARAVGPIGRVNSSVRDMLRYARLHLEGGSGVISENSVKAMQEVTAKGQLDDDFGITWWMRDLLDARGNKTRMILHGGAANGQMSDFWLIPSRNFACVILTNAEKGRFLNRELTAWIQEHLLELRAPEDKRLEPDEATLQTYVGSYKGHAFGTIIELYSQDKSLFYKTILGDVSSVTTTPAPPPPPARCAVLEKERLLVLEGDTKNNKMEILRGGDGNIQWLRSGGRLYERQG
jgi:CubicO group peptidase (beta-lactamase class C family)